MMHGHEKGSVGPLLCADPKLKGRPELWHVPQYGRVARSGTRWPCHVLPGLSLQMLSEMLVHLEHGHFVLAKYLSELVVGQDLAAVLRVL